MLFCYKCGEILDDQIRQCSNCGAVIDLKNESKSTSLPIKPGVGKQKNIISYILLATLGFLLITIIIFLFLIFPTGNDSFNKLTNSKYDNKNTSVSTNEKENKGNVENSSLKKVHNAMQQLTTSIFGKDNSIDEHLGIDKVLTSSTDIETSRDYHYTKLQVPLLFTDLMQLGGYSMQKQIVDATKISIEQENMIGQKIENALLNGIYKGKVNNDKKTSEYLNDLGQFLAKKVIRKGINYKFYLLDDDQFNALAYPGGRIFIFTGLLKHISNEAELAAILAHEIKHIDLRHTIALYQIAMKIQGGDDPSDFILFLESLAQHPYSGRIEADADRRGLELAYSCGYSPFQIVEFWRRLAGGTEKKSTNTSKNPFEQIIDQAGKELINILDSHPDAKTRYILLQNHTIQLLQKYPTEIFYIGKWNFSHRIPMYQHTK